MPTYVGADWASGLWVAVAVTADTVQIHTEPAIANVWHEYEKDGVFVIDMPIGLPADGPRLRDEEASGFLKSRSSTVFSVPAREAVYANDYEEAKRRNEEANCGGLGSQSWGLVPRIKEVDVFLQEYDAASERVYESHPEVCFAKIADGEELPKKDTTEGFERRLELLRKLDPELATAAQDFVTQRTGENSEWHHRIQSRRIDDVLDAAVLALTGKQLGLSSRTETDSYPKFPAETTQTDGENLPMEISYPGLR